MKQHPKKQMSPTIQRNSKRIITPTYDHDRNEKSDPFSKCIQNRSRNRAHLLLTISQELRSTNHYIWFKIRSIKIQESSTDQLENPFDLQIKFGVEFVNGKVAETSAHAQLPRPLASPPVPGTSIRPQEGSQREDAGAGGCPRGCT